MAALEHLYSIDEALPLKSPDAQLKRVLRSFIGQPSNAALHWNARREAVEKARRVVTDIPQLLAGPAEPLIAILPDFMVEEAAAMPGANDPAVFLQILRNTLRAGVEEAPEDVQAYLDEYREELAEAEEAFADADEDRRRLLVLYDLLWHGSVAYTDGRTRVAIDNSRVVVQSVGRSQRTINFPGVLNAILSAEHRAPRIKQILRSMNFSAVANLVQAALMIPATEDEVRQRAERFARGLDHTPPPPLAAIYYSRDMEVVNYDREGTIAARHSLAQYCRDNGVGLERARRALQVLNNGFGRMFTRYVAL